MNIGKAFPSNYLKASDFQGKRSVMTIESVVIENIGDEDKPIVYFNEAELGLVLNKTNANMISEIAKSEETDNWLGIKIILYSTRVDFQGRRVDAIRVDVPAASDAANENGKPALDGGPPNYVAMLGAAILKHTNDDKAKAQEMLYVLTGTTQLRELKQADAQKGYEAFKLQYVDNDQIPW
jgi:hypothetical protein